MVDQIAIGDNLIGGKNRPFIIAEMSGNHNQSLVRALEIVEAAAEAGAHALKLQTYTADTMTLDIEGGEFFISDPDSLWQGNSLYKLYQQAYTPWEWHEPIMQRCKELGLICFSTPFDESAVGFLESLDVPAYKIASFENTDLPLIKKVAALGKPMIVSTGMATIADLDDVVRTIREAGCNNFVLLKCTSTYPTSPADTNILTIPHMRELFGCQVGLSDHTMGIGVALASVALGATVVEKHFTLCRADGGVDSAFSIEPQELAALVVESERAWQGLGRVQYGAQGKEKDMLQYRRSLYIAEDIQAGMLLTKENLRALRPGLGLRPKYLDILIGKRVCKNLKKGTPFSWDLLA